MYRLFLKILVFLLCSYIGAAQQLLQEIEVADQIAMADMVVAGKIINKNSYRATNNHIYTLNTLELYSLFKGEVTTDTLNIVTKGGSIGLDKEEVRPSLKLKSGMYGLFILQKAPKQILSASATESYQTVASLQSFFKYNLRTNSVKNLFVQEAAILSFEEQIAGITNKYEELKSLSIAENRSAKTEETPILRSFTPTTIRAGIGEQISIIGENFGDTPGIISFKNPDDGGASFQDAFTSSIISWSDTQIIVEVPSVAGSGEIQLINNSGEFAFSSRELTVISTEVNAEFDSFPDEEFRVKLYNADDNGGYTWTFTDNFITNTEAAQDFTTAVAQWVCETNISWLISEEVTSINITENDGVNVVSFKDPFDFDANELSPGVLAVTTTYYRGCENGGDVTTYVEDVDITFASNFDWFYGEGRPSGSQNDFLGTAIHELGHAHNLGHVIAPTNLMHFETESGENSATREIDDDSSIGAQLSFAFSKTGTGGLCDQKIINDRDCDLTDDTFIEDDEIRVIELEEEQLLVLNSKAINFLGIFDLQGRKIKESIDNQLNLSGLSTGIYILVLEDESGSVFVKKIAKQ